MPRVIIAGISWPVIQRNRGYVPSFPGWEVLLFNSHTTRIELQHCWKEVLAAVHALDHDGAHILCFEADYSYEDTRTKYESTVGRRHRLLWMDPSIVKYFGDQVFEDRLRPVVDFEDEWRGKIRPAGVASPLFLPETCFEPKSQVSSHIWERSYKVRRNVDDINAVKALVPRFRREHYQDGYWEDNRKLQFRRDPSDHVTTLPDHQWKFTFQLPRGFHFDVMHPRGQGFHLRDPAGQNWFFDTHANVDCHGYIR